MSGVGALDVRLPIGALFTVLGLLLAVYGIATAGDADHYMRSLSVNINLWWGLTMLVFGLLLLWAASRARRVAAARPALATPEGRRTEALEHERGLEH